MILNELYLMDEIRIIDKDPHTRTHIHEHVYLITGFLILNIQDVHLNILA